MNGEYNLTPKYTPNKNKSFYLVKFTDFAQKHLEKSINNKSYDIKIALEPKENNGIIKFVDKPTSQNISDGVKPVTIELSFNIQDVTQLGYAEGTFECIKFKKGQFQAMGKIKQKFSITAHDNIYQDTKDKMAIADEINKQIRVKEIKSAATTSLNRNSPGARPSCLSFKQRKLLLNNTPPPPSSQLAHKQNHLIQRNPSPLTGSVTNGPDFFGRNLTKPFFSSSSSISPSLDKFKTASAPNSASNTPKTNVTTYATTPTPSTPGSSVKCKDSPIVGSDNNQRIKRPISSELLAATNKKVNTSSSLIATSASGNNNNTSSSLNKTVNTKENAIFMKNAALFKPIPFTFDKIKPSTASSTPLIPPLVAAAAAAVNTTTNKNNQQMRLNETTPKNDGQTYTLKEIVMRALALRPHKRSELIAIIERDHQYVKTDDWSTQLTGVLNSLGIFNSNNNAYTLARHAYNEINLDSNLYTEVERSIIDKKIPTSFSPTPLDNKTPPHLKQLKNLSSLDSSTFTLTGVESASPRNSVNKSSKGHKKLKKSDKLKKNLVSEASSIATNILDKSIFSQDRFATDYLLEHNAAPIQSYMSTLVKLPTVYPPLEDDYKREFTAITDSSKRDAYKTTFEREYTEYRKLHKKLQHVFNKFALLNQKLQSLERGTPEYQEVRKKFMANYKELIKPVGENYENLPNQDGTDMAHDVQSQQQTEYVKRRRRFEYLHARLTHVKYLVETYDKTVKTQ